MMPPLPEPVMKKQFVQNTHNGEFTTLSTKRYSESQMIDYGKLCRKLALEEAMMLCGKEKWPPEAPGVVNHIDIYDAACDDCARAIELKI